MNLQILKFANLIMTDTIVAKNTLCSYNNCNGKIIKHYKHCIKHLKHEVPPKIEKPKHCQVCNSGCTHLELVQYCCGHWMHQACLVETGKSRCPVCNKLVYVSAGALKQIKKITQERQELAAYPLLISFEIDIQKDDAVAFKYVTNKNYKHEKIFVTDMVKLLRKQIIENMYTLDIALLMNTRQKEYPDFEQRSDHVDAVCKDTLDKIMKHVLDILPTSKYRYIPVKIIPSVRVYPPSKMVRSIAFYCNFQSKYTTDDKIVDKSSSLGKPVLGDFLPKIE